MSEGLKTVGVLCLIRSGDHVLLLRRSKPGPLQDCYVPIGGHVEPHEAPRAAAAREAGEEAGVQLEPQTLSFCGVLVETSPTSYNWVTFVYLAEIGERIDPPECREGTLEWVPLDRLGDVKTPPTDATIYAHILAGTPFVLDALYNEELDIIDYHEEISDTHVPTSTGIRHAECNKET